MPTAPDLSLLKPGVKVRLRGDAKPQPRKPYPRGWRTVQQTALPLSFRVESDERWLPVSLIEEIVVP